MESRWKVDRVLAIRRIGHRRLSPSQQHDGTLSILNEDPVPESRHDERRGPVGVINADGGDIRWMKTPGDPRNTYLVSVDWTANSKEIYLQHFNRLQNTLNVLVADAASGDVRSILTEKG
jgi:dipeptidyl-peptidase-4